MPTDIPFPLSGLTPDACVRALAARDPRFDGLFFVGITSTRIYCRPVCPARVSHTDRRRFFQSPAAAEQAGYRPCLRCRPELAPGRAPVDAVSRLGAAAARRIESGALNGHSVTELAKTLGVSARHLRRALDREYGVSPSELAQTYRLLLAKRLLADTALPVTRIAFASGFQSLRRFNAAFREQYRMSPSSLRRAPHPNGRQEGSDAQLLDDALHLTLAYRSPFDWRGLLAVLARDAIPGVESVSGDSYSRTVRLDGHTGFLTARDGDGHLIVHISASLVPVLMPLLPGLRRLFDLDAEPLVIDDHLARTDLAPLVQQRPGVRLPGTIDPFEVALGVISREGSAPGKRLALLQRMMETLGDSFSAGAPDLQWLAPSAAVVARTSLAGLTSAGLDDAAGRTLLRVAQRMAEGSLLLDAGADPVAAQAGLTDAGASDETATRIVMRALYWPDAFPASNPALLARTEPWRPWRAYGATHLWLARGERRRLRRSADGPALRRQPQRGLA